MGGQRIGVDEFLRHARRAASLDIDADEFAHAAKERDARLGLHELKAAAQTKLSVIAGNPCGAEDPVALVRWGEIVELVTAHDHAAVDPGVGGKIEAERL